MPQGDKSERIETIQADAFHAVEAFCSDTKSGHRSRLLALVNSLLDRAFALSAARDSNAAPQAPEAARPGAILHGYANSAAEEVNTPAVAAPASSARAPIHPLVEAVRWVLNDAAYKAPEQIGDVAERWIDKLRGAMALEGEPASAKAEQLPAQLKMHPGLVAIVDRLSGTPRVSDWPADDCRALLGFAVLHAAYATMHRTEGAAK